MIEIVQISSNNSIKGQTFTSSISETPSSKICGEADGQVYTFRGSLLEASPSSEITDRKDNLAELKEPSLPLTVSIYIENYKYNTS